ncbi:MAG: phosphoadenosine phosphosulfate reductase family protein [Candidatus Bipolaricaulia bacterium]
MKMTLTDQEKQELAILPLTEKLEYGKQVIRKALADEAGADKRPVVLWTGGKDSTVLMWLIREAVDENIPALLIDHGLHFPQTWEFAEQVKRNWDLQLDIARNEDVITHAGEPNTPIQVADLNEINRREVRNVLGYTEETFPYTLDTEVGNHLLKTVALKEAIREHGYTHVFVGIRWDEHPARATEQLFSPRQAPDHLRAHPILPLTEADIWTVMRQEQLPTHPLYAQGYRSLDSVAANKTDDRPAWEQELGVGERAGREQDKEDLMERLRALGYM